MKKNSSAPQVKGHKKDKNSQVTLANSTTNNTDYSTISSSISDIRNQHNLLQQTIIDHNSYTDSEGKTGSNSQWFLFHIKTKITEAFGNEFYEMSNKEVKLIGDLYDTLRHIIIESEKSGLSRHAIKDHVYNMIDTFRTGGVQ